MSYYTVGAYGLTDWVRDLFSGPGDGRAAVDSSISTLAARVGPTAEKLPADYRATWVNLLSDWDHAKTTGLTTTIVKAFAGRLESWVSQLPALGIDVTGIKVPTFDGDKGASLGWIKWAVLAGGVATGAYLVWRGLQPRPGAYRDEAG